MERRRTLRRYVSVLRRLLDELPFTSSIEAYATTSGCEAEIP